MAPETKGRARAKLAAFTPKIGYPDQLARLFERSRSAAATLLGNAMRAAEFEYDDQSQQARPADPTAGNGA